MKIGYSLASEEFLPRQLLEQAQAAEQAGFQNLWISDRYHPWNDPQGQSPFVWTMIGALAEAVPTMRVTTAMTWPHDPHPPGRDRSGHGDGYVLLAPERDTGGRVPLAGRWPEAGPRRLEGLLRDGRGSREEDRAPAVERPGVAVASCPLVLPTPELVEQSSSPVSEDVVTEPFPCGPDLDRHLRKIRKVADAGVDDTISEPYECTESGRRDSNPLPQPWEV